MATKSLAAPLRFATCKIGAPSATHCKELPTQKVHGFEPLLGFRLCVVCLSVTQSRFWGRGCDEALFSEEKGDSVKRGEAIRRMGGLVGISTGKAIQ